MVKITIPRLLFDEDVNCVTSSLLPMLETVLPVLVTPLSSLGKNRVSVLFVYSFVSSCLSLFVRPFISPFRPITLLLWTVRTLTRAKGNSGSCQSEIAVSAHLCSSLSALVLELVDKVYSVYTPTSCVMSFTRFDLFFYKWKILIVFDFEDDWRHLVINNILYERIHVHN